MASINFQRFLKNFNLKLISDVMARLLTFFMTIIIARVLSPNEFGVFSYAIALATTWTLAMDFGWNNMLMRKSDFYELNIFSQITVFLKTLIFIVILSFAFFYFLLFPNFFRLSNSIFIFALMYACGLSFQEFYCAVIASQERFNLEWIIRIVPRGFPFLILPFLVYGDRSSLMAIGILGVSGFFGTLVVGLWLKRKLRFGHVDLRFNVVKNLLIEGAPFGLSIIFWGIYAKSDIIILGFLGTSMSEIGIYGAALKMIDFLRGIPGVFYFALVPIFSTFIKEKKDFRPLLIKILIVVLFSGLLLFPIVYWGAPFVFKVIFGESFVRAAIPFTIGIVGVLFFMMNIPFWVLLTLLGKGKLNLLSNSLMLMISLVSNLTFIPKYGINGAAISMVLAEVGAFLINFLFLWVRLKKI